MPGDQSRHDEVIDRVRRQGAQGIDLFGHAHGSEFRGEGGADAARDHKAGQHRAELAAHRNAHHREHGGVHFDFVELDIRLRSEHHAGEGAGDEHDRL